MSGTPSQLVLRFPRIPGFAATDLLPHDGQAEARAWLGRAASWPLGRLALFGPRGSGKSHLAHAWADSVGGAVLPAAPNGSWPRAPVAIDSLDDEPDELALLYLLNAANESHHPVLLIARTPAARLPVRLPDLASRLRATTAVGIEPPDDAFLQMLLARLLAERQLRLPATLQSWLLTRLPRTPSALRDAVIRLDAAALQAGRTITRPLAAQVLDLCDNSNSTPSGTSPVPPGMG